MCLAETQSVARLQVGIPQPDGRGFGNADDFGVPARTAPELPESTLQTTEHQIFSVVEGTGRTVVGEGENQTEIEWGPRDHFVIPGWYPYAHETEGEVVLFSFSDQVSQKKLGLWREQRHD